MSLEKNKEFKFNQVSNKDFIFKDVVLVVSESNLKASYDFVHKRLVSKEKEILTIDGVNLKQKDRVLLVGQEDKRQNGVYELLFLGSDLEPWVLGRSNDFNETTKINQGVSIIVALGRDNGDTVWHLPYIDSLKLDETPLNFIKDARDSPLITERVFKIVGDSSTVIWEFEHDLNTINLTHEILNFNTKETVFFDFKRIDPRRVCVYSGVPIGEGNNFLLIIRG